MAYFPSNCSVQFTEPSSNTLCPRTFVTVRLSRAYETNGKIIFCEMASICILSSMFVSLSVSHSPLLTKTRLDLPVGLGIMFGVRSCTRVGVKVDFID